MPRAWIGYLYMFATIVLYATIGVVSRTSNVSEYYVAGRRVPALFNGMATAADWISAASFISLAGTPVPARLRRPRLRDGLDRRLLPGGPADRALPAQVRPVHHPRLPGGALRRRRQRQRRRGAPDRGRRHHHRLLHLRRRADLRGRPDRLALHGRRFLGRDLPRPGQHPGVLLPGRHARHHLDPGGAVHHHPGRLPDPDHVAVRSNSPAIRCRRSPTARCCPSWPSARPSWQPTRANRKCAPSSSAAPTTTNARLARPAALVGSGQRRGASAALDAAARAATRLLAEVRAAERAADGLSAQRRTKRRACGASSAPPTWRAPSRPNAHAEPFPGADRAQSRTSAATTSWRWCSA